MCNSPGYAAVVETSSWYRKVSVRKARVMQGTEVKHFF